MKFSDIIYSVGTLLAVGAFVLVVAVYNRPATAPAVDCSNPANQNSADCAGAAVGPELPFPSITINGLQTFYNRKVLTQAASTTCSFKSPTATSSLIDGGIRFLVATSSGTMFIEMARATDPYSTTTLIGTKYALTNGAQDTIPASTTPQAGNANVFAPNTYFNIKIGGSQAITSQTVPTGTCEATFRVY